MGLIQNKYHDQARQVRVMQEKLIDNKRKRGIGSPAHPSSPADEHHITNVSMASGGQFGERRIQPPSPMRGGYGSGSRAFSSALGSASPAPYSRHASPHRMAFDVSKTGGAAVGADRSRYEMPSSLGRFGGLGSGGGHSSNFLHSTPSASRLASPAPHRSLGSAGRGQPLFGRSGHRS